MSHAPVTTSITVEDCKKHIETLYRTCPRVHLNIALSHSKMVQDAKATIVGVYRHCFCVEESSCGALQRHTFTYADLLTRRVEVLPCE